LVGTHRRRDETHTRFVGQSTQLWKHFSEALRVTCMVGWLVRTVVEEQLTN
jgi:hypothetical protein